MDPISPLSLPPLRALPPWPATEPPIPATGISGPTTPVNFSNLHTNDYPDAGDDFHFSVNELLGGAMPSPNHLASAVCDAACYSWWLTDLDDISWPESTSGWVPTIDHVFGSSCCSFGGETTKTQLIATQKPNFHDQSSSSPESPYDDRMFTNHGLFTITERNPKRVTESYDGFPAAVDKPADDGHNWRKYGQKQVKGSEYPRGYYKCTYFNCTVKKNVERSRDGHITEIIYMGHHGHEAPRPWIRLHEDDDGRSVVGGDEDSQQETSDHFHGTSDSEESEVYQMFEEDGDDQDTKKRKGGAGMSNDVTSRTAMKKRKVIVETRSDVDLLDDGYRWRKYGQKVVKGNPNPRSYYKCTSKGCSVRKHVERCAGEPGAVLTAYVGRHDHDAPACVNRSQCDALHETDFGDEDRKPTTHKRLKEEQVSE